MRLNVIAPILFLGVALAMPTDATAADPAVPERRFATTENIDFHGGDLLPRFDTSPEACGAICLSDPDCVAFTYNTRARACFPKGSIGELRGFDGALSARVMATAPEVLARARRAETRLGFLQASDLGAVREFTLELSQRYTAGEWDAEDHAAAGAEAEARGEPARARAHYGAAMTRGDRAGYWLTYARLHLEARDQRPAERRDFAQRALDAATGAYLRAADDATSAGALERMAQALEMLGRGRDMIPALRLAQDHVPGTAQALLDHALANYGFRLLDHRVEADSASPRVCAVFSEDLARGVDLAPFVQTDVGGLAVTGEGQELCVAGLAHGSRYELRLREGLPAASGETLPRTVPLAIYVRDRAPMVRFAGRGHVLPAAGTPALPVETVNTETLDLVLRRVSDSNLAATLRGQHFGQQLQYWQDEMVAEELMEEVWQGTGHVESPLNRTVTTRLPLDGLALEPGVYVLRADIPGTEPYDIPPAMQWFMVSDIGLTALSGTDGLTVVALGLEQAAPLADAEVSLVSRGNRVLGTARTDARGVVRFAPGLTRGRGNAAPSHVIARTEGDTGFLPLTDSEFDLSDRGAAGRAAAGPIDVFLTTERGAYRAGEVVHVTALARDDLARAIPGLPLSARLLRPDGVEYARALADGEAAGGHVFALPLATTAPRGVWRLEILADTDAPPLASRTLLVEDFLPERLDLALDLPEGAIDPDAPPTLEIAARYLFGAPAAGLPVEGDVTLLATDKLEGYPGFRFGRHDSGFEPLRRFLDSGLRTGPDGSAALPLMLPEVRLPARPLTMNLRLAVSEGSGRPVERRLERPLRVPQPVVGIRPAFDDDLPENAEAVFDLIAVDAEGAPADDTLNWQIDRVETRYQWFSVHGQWNWEPVTTRTRVAEGSGAVAGKPLRITAPVAWGRHEIRVEGAGGAQASMPFNAGWYAPAGVRDTPDMLEIGLDRAEYAPGDTARLRVVPRDAGTALVSVLSGRVIDMRLVEVSEGENLIELPVTDDWGAGVYVAVSALRPMAPEAGRNPARSLGLAHASVDPGARQLAVAFDAPAEADPRGPLTVGLTVDGVEDGDTAHVTIAAVDVGILNLTGFENPDPAAHYFGQRMPGVAIRDLYGRLIDGMSGSLGAVRSGGDAATVSREAPPPTEDLVAFFTGPLAVEQGRVDVDFDLPAFNGTVRLMAVAWSARGVGQAAAEVLVRDPVVVQASLPRFLAPGDESRLLLELTHASGPAGDVQLDVQGPGIDPADVPERVDLAEGGRVQLDIPLRAAMPGDHEITVSLTLPDGRTLRHDLLLPVRVNDPEIARSSRFTLGPGDTFTLDDAVFAGLVPGTASAALAAGPGAALDAPGLMRRLAGYPWGCTEQVASAALPMLFAADLARDMGLATTAQARTRVDGAIAAVLANQSSNGGFGLWRAGAGDLWLDAYATDFLTRARDAGHEVSATALGMALDNLRNRVNRTGDVSEGGAPLAHALYVLAREGAAAVGDLRYFADARSGAFDTPLAAAHLGAALAAYGDPARADGMFVRAVGLLDAAEPEGWREDYGTALRDAAGLLALSVEAGSDVADRAALSARISSRAPAHALSPQEAVWSLRAAQALRHDPPDLSLNGTPATSTITRLLEPGGAAQFITNTGRGDASLTLTVFGVSAEPEPAGGDGYRIERRHYTLEGAPVDPASVPAGTRLVTMLEIRPFDPALGRLMVVDPLPAGFEIDNPNLLRAGDIAALDWLDVQDWAEMTEARADRFLAAVDWGGTEPLRLAYIARAVTPGSYHHPAASVEDMYRPTRRARTAAGSVTVTR